MPLDGKVEINRSKGHDIDRMYTCLTPPQASRGRCLCGASSPLTVHRRQYLYYNSNLLDARVWVSLKLYGGAVHSSHFDCKPTASRAVRTIR